MSDPVSDVSIDERLTRIEEQLQRLTNTLDTALPTIGMAVDTADEVAERLQNRGVDIDERSREVLAVVEQLTEPVTLDAVRQLVEALPRLVPVVQLATTFRDTTGMLFDMADAQVESLRVRGIDVETRLGQALDLLARLTDPIVHEHLLQLVDAAPGLLAATRTGELFGRAVDEASQSTRSAVGVWGLLAALREPEVQRATGFALDVVRRVGERLPEAAGSAHLLPTAVPDTP